MGPKKKKQEGPTTATNQKKCDHFDRGYCKHGKNCFNFHPDRDQICLDTNCPNSDCNLRHPNPCKYGSRCYFWKKNECLFSHVTLACGDNKKAIMELEVKVKCFETQRKKDHETFKTEINGIFEGFDNKIKALENMLEEKNLIIANLGEKLDKMEAGLEEIAVNGVKGKNSVVKAFECKECDFKSDSSKGLKTHIKRKHKYEDVESFPVVCEFCDYEIKDKKGLKKHSITHSYKNVNFQCEECDFLGENEHSMVVHIGKKHSENIECGLCDTIFKNIEQLETHLTTCEIFRCFKSHESFKTLLEMKKHIENEHEERKFLSVIHIKQSRTNSEQIHKQQHKIADLFPDLVNYN